MVEPMDPLEGCELHRLQASPRPAWSNHLRLVQPDDGLGQGVDAPICQESALEDDLTFARVESRRVAPPPLRDGPSGDSPLTSAPGLAWPEGYFRPRQWPAPDTRVPRVPVKIAIQRQTGRGDRS